MTHLPAKLGKYEIRRALGRGAMGVVFEGYDPVIDRVVAIKTMHGDEVEPEVAQEQARRFLVEAKAAGRLSHRNIVALYDYGEEGGLVYTVLEYVRGRELAAVFAQGRRIPLPQVVAWMGELLDALGYAHARGVVHRDVKPHNIFITDDGHVKLGDFGVARIDASLRTHEDLVLGTPAYMAPEQISGDAVDARSDLYSAGVVLYQCLTGEQPFTGGMVPVIHKVLTEMPRPPSVLADGVPAELDAVVLKALAKAPVDRYATSAEFARALLDAAWAADGDDGEQTVVLSSTWPGGAVPTRPGRPVAATRTFAVDPLEEPVAAQAPADSLGAVVPGEPMMDIDPLQVAPGDWALGDGPERPMRPSALQAIRGGTAARRSPANGSGANGSAPNGSGVNGSGVNTSGVNTSGERRLPRWTATTAGSVAAVAAVAVAAAAIGWFASRPGTQTDSVRAVDPPASRAMPPTSASTPGAAITPPAAPAPAATTVLVPTSSTAGAAPASAEASAPVLPTALDTTGRAPLPAATQGIRAAPAAQATAASQPLSPDMAAAWQRALDARARLDATADGNATAAANANANANAATTPLPRPRPLATPLRAASGSMLSAADRAREARRRLEAEQAQASRPETAAR